MVTSTVNDVADETVQQFGLVKTQQMMGVSGSEQEQQCLLPISCVKDGKKGKKKSKLT